MRLQMHIKYLENTMKEKSVGGGYLYNKGTQDPGMVIKVVTEVVEHTGDERF